MNYPCPYFISPHAIIRFQERVSNIPAAEVINFIQAELQWLGEPLEWEVKDGVLTPIFQRWYNRSPVYLPVAPGNKSWPTVPTVHSIESAFHWHWRRNKSGGVYLKDEKRYIGP